MGRHAHFRQPWIGVGVPGYKRLESTALMENEVSTELYMLYVLYKLSRCVWSVHGEKARCCIFANQEYDHRRKWKISGNSCKQPTVHGWPSL